MNARRAMTSEHASTVKTAGHRNEYDFASLIRGEVNRGSHTDKKDVIDKKHRAHSVKAGTWWQIFLYSRERLRTNTIFQGLGGDIADIMIACIDSYPEKYEDYKADKKSAKLKLQPNMRRLLKALEKPQLLASFFEKALFDGGNADFLSMYLGPAKDPIEKKIFHVFHKDDVVTTLTASDLVRLRNSKARNKNQMDDQKVTFYSKLHRKNMGEIEDRHDSPGHYREMKFRLNAEMVFELLCRVCKTSKKVSPQVVVYGKAIKLLKI